VPIPATIVNGLRVIAEQKAKSPLWTPDKPVYFTRIVELVLDDGSTIQGCKVADCTFTGSVGSVRSHLSRHSDTDGAPRPAKDQLLKLTTTELLEKAAAADHIAKDRDRWRARATKAERKLRSIQNALRPAT
jgi:hypothetical protein